MTHGLSVQDGGILYGILADLGGDIVLKTDRFGFIEHASSGLADAGIDVSAMLIAPHIADLTNGDHADRVRSFCERALSRETGLPSPTLEFPLCPDDRDPTWYAMTLRALPSNLVQTGRAHGAIAVLRCVDQKRALEFQLVESSLKDPLTGIANRRAFLDQVSGLMAVGQGGCIALFEIDRFRAIGLRFGQQASDSVIQAFANFLRTMLDEAHVLARLEDNRFALMMPHWQREEAIDFASEIVSTFAEFSRDAELEEMRLTASASVSQLSADLDETLVRGEVALTLARSAGGFRVECGDALRRSWGKRKIA